VGDPACDLVIAWTFFDDASRDAFRHALALDDATWARARGWALWKALITLAEDERGGRTADASARRVGWRYGAGDTVALLLEDHARSR
jgi:aminoglycoside phosphotransferase (APT) family kinase protein